MIATLLGRGIYSIANPWGPAPPIVLAGNIAGSAFFGAGGALWGGAIARVSRRPARAALAGAIGILLTAAHDLVTNLATVVVMGALARPVPVLIAGIPFAIAHVASNAAIFAVLAGPLLERIAPAPPRSPR